MNRGFMVQTVAAVNFKKWPVQPNVWISFGLYALFSAVNLSWVMEYSAAVKTRIAPWIFPHVFMLPAMLAVFGGTSITLFAGAPFCDGHTQFLRVRAGNGIWLAGQLLYIAEAAAVQVIYQAVLPAILCLPRLFLTTEWGTVIQRLGKMPGEAANYGILPVGLSFSGTLVTVCPPWKAMLLSMLLTWLVSLFLGMLIFFFNALLWDGAGVPAAFALCVVAYFCTAAGNAFFGTKPLYVSPINWINIAQLSPFGSGPSVQYAVMVLAAGITLFGTAGYILFLRKER